MSRQVKAFTILELLVALAISGIVISIAGMAFSLTTKQFNDYRITSNTIAKAFSLDARLKTDLFNSVNISRNQSTIDIERSNRPGVTYSFHEQFVLRVEDERVDTFRIALTDISFFFKNEAVDEGTIDELRFNAVVLGDPETFRYYRRYGAERVINELKEEDRWR